jgi:peroxiredoxin
MRHAWVWWTVAMTLVVGCEKSSPPVPAPPPPSPVSAAPEAPRVDAPGVLRESREVIAGVGAISFTLRVVQPGGIVRVEGQASARRAEAGGWLLHLRGTVHEQDGTGATRQRPFEVAYDGLTARSVRAEDRVVLEATAEEWFELAAFLDAQIAPGASLGEVLGEFPLPGDEANARFEKREEVAGVECDIIVPGGAQGGATVRYALATGDRLPRRIERDDGSIIELAQVRIDSDATGSVYALQVPRGFRVREAGVMPRRRDMRRGGPPGGEEVEPLDDDVPRPLQVGDEAPSWELKDASGNLVRLTDYRGKVVVMDFWGTWCGWCIKAMPAMERVHRRYKDRGVVVLGMNTEFDPGADPGEFMKRNNCTYGLILNAEKITKQYGVVGFPQMYVIGRDGRIAACEIGYRADIEERLSGVIDKALGE